jgi:hypothetical protein
MVDFHKIPGWCSEKKALLMMDLIKNHNCKLCVDIGAFYGKSSFPMAKTLKHINSGLLYAIDAYNSDEACIGYEIDDPNFIWWHSLYYDEIHSSLKNLFQDKDLNAFCTVIKSPSIKAAALFLDNSIELIHFDGNHDQEISYQDVTTYFPKIREGGFIILNDYKWSSLNKALFYLLERCDVLSDFSNKESYILLKKSNSKAGLINEIVY